ncbi:FtsK/SpoIIIE domain-containing protein [uncultured Cellulomonas sp.]|uniref:FtsK/SpoIIIE domain-containing protein n=1 Tax=uncultured Cellulomonas sp. TaxID=189682 RepID=UPI002623705B|nr:FtsK/SpoIIIE domain-containing protein [uncultured Cellulomonas sp.]
MNRLGGDRREHGPMRLNVAKVRVPLTAVLAAWAGRQLASGVWWLLRHPLAVALAVAALMAVRVTATRGPVLVLSVAAVAVAVLVAWWRVYPRSFVRLVVWRTRGLWRAATVYRWVWQPAMVTAGLAVRVDGTGYLPRLVSVASTGAVDVVRVRMLPGQTLTDWASNTQRLAQTFGAVDCRVRTVPGRAHDLALWFLTTDPLTAPVEPFEPADPPRLGALPVAVGEDGLVHHVRLLGAHVLVIGATGSGKGSVLWSLLAAVAPGIRDGLVQVWAIDPKGGMELAPGRALFARFVYGDTADGADTTGYELEFARGFEDAVTVMRRRQSALRGRSRLHTPTADEPLIVVIVDELASLTAYVNDRDAKRRIIAALSLLLSQGRAVGVSVVGAVQDPRKDVISMRDLFPTRILLRVTEPEHVALALGQGARDRGARADLIDEATPGVAYVGQDGAPEAARVRFTHVTDADIAALAQAYAPRSMTALPAVAEVA